MNYSFANFFKQRELGRSLINLTLRVLSLGSKFLLILYVTKFLGTTNLGSYGIFNTTVLLGIQFLGFDFYVFNTRELLSGDRLQPFLINQLYFHLILYGITIPVLVAFFYHYHFIETDDIPFLAGIVVLEHISSEFYRLLLTLKRTLLGSFILFLRTSSWILVLILFWELNLLPLNLKSLYILWIIGNCVSLLIPVVALVSSYNWNPNDFRFLGTWLLKGIRISLPFFVCTIFLKILEYSNRYIIDFFHGKVEVGVYTFYSNFAGTLSIGVFTLVTMVQFPIVVELGIKGINNEFRAAIKKFTRDTIRWALLLSPFVIGLTVATLWYLKKDEFWSDFPSFLILVGANVLISINYATHYILFSLKRDFFILYSNLAGVALSLVLNFLLVPLDAQLGASSALAIGFFVVLFSQFLLIKKLLRAS